MAKVAFSKTACLFNVTLVQCQKNTSEREMWANAQRDGRPAEHRWRPLFNAAVWLTPTTRCRAVTLPRRETR